MQKNEKLLIFHRVLRRQDVGKVADKERWEVKLPAHGCALYRLSPGVTDRKMEGKWWEIR